MAQQASEDDISQAVLGFVTEGAYPEETVVAAKFPTAALAKELKLISQAREQVEVCIYVDYHCACIVVASFVFTDRYYYPLGGNQLP